MNCLDAETLAAWFDDGLSGAALEDARSHVAACARCQALVGAMGRTRAAVPSPESQPSRRWWLAWAVPAAAAATAVALWIAVPRPTNVAVTSLPSASVEKEQVQPQSAPPAAASSPAEVPAAPRPRPERELRDRSASATPPLSKQEAADNARQAPSALNEAVAVRPAAAPPAAENERTAAFGGQQARTLAAAASEFCGGGWPAPPADVASAITNGSARSTAVCWIIGRAGTVLRSTDQRSWQRLNFPVMVDLTSVNATDAQSASVVTADGRTFSTVDGGLSWNQPQ